MRRHCPSWLLYLLVGLLVLANAINIAADLAAMGDALRLLVGGRTIWYAVLFGAISVLLQLFVPYRRYVSILMWLTLSLLSYVAVAWVSQVPWAEVLINAIRPSMQWTPESLTMIVAVFGTTLSPYLFFWQASQEVEELRADGGGIALRSAPAAVARSVLQRIRADTYIGMGFSNVIALFVVVTAAVTLHRAGITNIETSAQAAEALRPIAGDLAFALFGIGIIGTGLLAIPVLAGSAAYAVAGSFRWRNSLESKPRAAPAFYGIIVVSMLAGVVMNLLPLDPIRALFRSAVVNGVVSVPMMLMGSSRKVMGEHCGSQGTGLARHRRNGSSGMHHVLDPGGAVTGSASARPQPQRLAGCRVAVACANWRSNSPAA